VLQIRQLFESFSKTCKCLPNSLALQVKLNTFVRTIFCRPNDLLVDTLTIFSSFTNNPFLESIFASSLIIITFIWRDLQVQRRHRPGSFGRQKE
jgi:hypothetical protein